MSLIHDYAEIRKRMLGDLKPKPKYTPCGWCGDTKLVEHMFGYPTECPYCRNPDKKEQP